MALAPQAWLLRGYARELAVTLLADIARVEAGSPLRRLRTRAGPMSVETTNCGSFGWIADTRGYRYSTQDPLTTRDWPPMPRSFAELARAAADSCGFADFSPDACLINCYRPGARMGLHQDRDEEDFSQPIVSVSLGLPAVFRWGGSHRNDPATGHLLQHGDVVVWGGRARLAFHGILPLKAGTHPQTGAVRYNLTFRRARQARDKE